jgi:hypothetical protein
MLAARHRGGHGCFIGMTSPRGSRERRRNLVRARVSVAIACVLGLLAARASPSFAPTPPALDAAYVIEPEQPDIRRLGETVAADGTLLAVAAPTDGDDALEPGMVEVHRLSILKSGKLAVKLEDTLFAPAQAAGEHFGASLAVLAACRKARTSGLIAIGVDRATVGEPSPMGVMAGAVDLFERRPQHEARWRLAARIFASQPQPGAEFGAAVAFDRMGSQRLAVGAPRTDVDGAFDSGRVHVFRCASESRGVTHYDGTSTPTTWHEVAVIDPPHPSMSGWFGASVALEGDILAIGSPGFDVALPGSNTAIANAGAVYIYRRFDCSARTFGQDRTDRRPLERYRLERVLIAPSPEQSAWFGLAIDLDRGVLAVGTPRARAKTDAAPPVGCVYVFDLAHPTTPPSRIDPPTTPFGTAPDFETDDDAVQAFGQALTLRGQTLLVGAPSTDVSENGERDATRGDPIEDVGAAWIFALDHLRTEARLTPPRLRPSALFGASSALTLIAPRDGAPRVCAIVGHLYLEEESTAPSTGAAIYVADDEAQTFTALRWIGAGNPANTPDAAPP